MIKAFIWRTVAVLLMLYLGMYALLLVFRFIGGGWYAVVPGKHETGITAGIRRAYKKGQAYIPVNKVTDFSWARVCMFDTATDRDRVRTAVALPIAWDKRTIPWLYHGDYWTLVFTDESKVVAVVKLRKGQTGDPAIREPCQLRSDAVFFFFKHDSSSRHDIMLMTEELAAGSSR